MVYIGQQPLVQSGDLAAPKKYGVVLRLQGVWVTYKRARSSNRESTVGSCNLYVSRLPASFTGLYRLFLRSFCRCAIPQMSTYEPHSAPETLFGAAAEVVTKELEHNPQSDFPDRKGLLVDNIERTWSAYLLYISVSNSPDVDHALGLQIHLRDMPHQLVRNLAHEKQRIRLMQARLKVRDQRIADEITAHMNMKAKDVNTLVKKQKEAQFEFSADGALSEIIQIAEGCGNVTLDLGRESTSQR